jgi:predicted PurR-regulated permease PerM
MVYRSAIALRRFGLFSPGCRPDANQESDTMQSNERHIIGWLLALAALVLAVGLLRSALLPFIIGLAISYMLNPLADWLHDRGLGRGLASLLIVALFSILALLVLFILVPWIAAELRDVALNLPRYIEQARKMVEDAAVRWLGRDALAVRAKIDQGVTELSQQWTGSASTVILSVLNGGKAIVDLASVVLITPVVAFYMLNDWPRMLASIDSWLPRDHAETIRRLAYEVNGVLAGFARGQAMVCLALAAVYAIGLSWAGIKFGALIGLVTGLMSFIPFVAFAIGLLIAATVAIVEFWPNWVPLAKVGGVFALGQVLESAVLSPRIVAGHIKLHPVWIILALFVFGYLFGFVGMLVAVPTAAAIGVMTRFGLQEYLKSPLYRGQKVAATENKERAEG